MPKVSTNIRLDADFKAASINLFKNLGMDLTIAATIFLKQSLRVHSIPFNISRENPETVAALNEYYEIKKHQGITKDTLHLRKRWIKSFLVDSQIICRT